METNSNPRLRLLPHL